MRAKFPFYFWKLFLFVIIWNVFFIADREILGYPVVGPFAAVAIALLATISFTIPGNRSPGRWLIKNVDFAWRWRYVFWYIGSLAAVMAAYAAYEVLFGL